MSTPEQAAASLEVRVRDALQPLGEAAAQLEAAARELREAAESGDARKAADIGQELLGAHVRFARVFRTWLARRPDARPWRSLVIDAHAPSRLPPGSDQIDRSST